MACAPSTVPMLGCCGESHCSSVSVRACMGAFRSFTNDPAFWAERREVYENINGSEREVVWRAHVGNCDNIDNLITKDVDTRPSGVIRQETIVSQTANTRIDNVLYGSSFTLRVTTLSRPIIPGYADLGGTVSLDYFAQGKHRVFKFGSPWWSLVSETEPVLGYCTASESPAGVPYAGGIYGTGFGHRNGFSATSQDISFILQNPGGAYCVEDISIDQVSKALIQTRYRNGESVSPLILAPDFLLAEAANFRALPDLASYPTPICGVPGPRSEFCNPLP